ncbi:unnamed protein product [Spodoptera littoralis]|uniref:Uncharacterized protein n=1 Tax=Spodoptera littoralis TaxID=7109 RepID=A0A9P0I5Z2_SPOLI|nr:unnamed protein product [Spodoptera littoralis]CAH1640537.1 unnamed protein product [Spodoptera littoralis]
MPNPSEELQLNIFKYPVIDLSTSLWIAKDIVLVICHSIQCEKFYITIEEAKMACIQLMKNKNCPSEQAQLYKKVLWKSRNFNKISIYGLMYVDAKLPISVIGLLTGYVVVLLQLNL